MPFGVGDVDKHRAGLGQAQKVRWTRTANNVLTRCLSGGGTDNTCAPQAIRIANSLFSESDADDGDLGVVMRQFEEVLWPATGEGQEPMDFDAFEPLTENDDAATALQEQIRSNGTFPMRIIKPGWGQSGYYSKEVLERDGRIFEGAHMYWDHPTQAEKRDRPERSIRDLAGIVEGPIQWQEDGPVGPGVYGHARVFSGYKDTVAEMAPHIGTSIRAEGLRGKETGEREGRRGPIVEALTKAQSVDFVTKPGAGGEIITMFESARGLNEDGNHREPEEVDVDGLEEAQRERDEALAQVKKLEEGQTAEATKLEEAETALARFREADVVGAARVIVTEAVGKYEMPDLTRDRIIESVSANPPTADGKLDEPRLRETVTEAIKAESKYLEEVTGAGQIRGMNGATGDGGAGAGSGEPATVEESTKALGTIFEGMGYEEKAATSMAAGR